MSDTVAFADTVALNENGVPTNAERLPGLMISGAPLRDTTHSGETTAPMVVVPIFVVTCTL